MTQDVQDVSDVYRAPLGKLAEELNQFLWEECGYMRWDQYYFLERFLKELCKGAIVFGEETERTGNILNKLLKKNEGDESSEVERMTELKPCPFCGCDVNSRSWTYKYDPLFHNMQYIECPQCGIRTPSMNNEYEMISVWNRRVEDD